MVYDYSGKKIEFNYDRTVKSVNHRGYSTVAPENTLPAFRLSKQMGFNYVETDVSFTSDGVPVLLHDSTINRTSNGSGSIGSLTFSQVRQYDFGSWKSSDYSGTLIPSLAEFLDLCKSIMLHPYIELKNSDTYTESQIQQIVDMVNAHGMRGKVTYISFSDTYLGYVKSYDDEARLGFLNVPNTYYLQTCLGLKTNKNEVFFDCSYYNGSDYNAITQEICNAFMAENIPIEAWTVNDRSVLLGLNKYVSGITSDTLIAGKVLYDNSIDEPEMTALTFVVGEYINTGGSGVNIGDTVDIANPSSYQFLKYAIANCQEGDTFLLNVTGAVSARAWTFLNSSNVLLSRADASVTISNTTITAPQNAAKIIVQDNGNPPVGTAYKL